MTNRTTRPDGGLYAALVQRGVSRRTFLRFSALMAATLALPVTYAPRIAAAVAASPRLPVIWLRGQDCAGNTQAFLGATEPTIAELLLELLSVDYHESMMAPAGAAAELSRTSTMEAYPDGYIAIVEGSIPTGDDGVYCMIGGRPFRDVVREVCDGALATIAVGACAVDGGTPAAAGGRTGAVGVAQAVSGGQLINLPGCPLNGENLAATIVHYLTFKQFPVTDRQGRPLFAYGGLIHNQCERRAHYEFGEYVTSWGDEAAQKGWCLYKMGCKGPEVYANCPTKKYADGISWPIKAGHGCIGCTMPAFWNTMGSPYRRLPPPLAFAPEVTVDQIGAVLVGGVAAVTMVHGTASIARAQWDRRTERRAPAAAGEAEATAIEPAAIEPAATAGAAPAEVTTTEATTAEATTAEATTTAEPTAEQLSSDGPAAPSGTEAD